MISLNAQVRIVGPTSDAERIIPLETLYRIPNSESERENILSPKEIVTHVILPPSGEHLSSAYEVRHGEGPDQPLATAAATLDVVAGTVKEAKVVLGQVAPIPWISAEASRAMVGKQVLLGNR